jgi:hypothetical protein
MAIGDPLIVKTQDLASLPSLKTSEYAERSRVEKAIRFIGILSPFPPVGGLRSWLQVVFAPFAGCFLRLKG